MEHYFALVSDWGYRPGNLRFALNQRFGSVDFDGCAMLDIGAGDGVVSLYAACMGARRVVALEPQSAGSRKTASPRFKRGIALLGLEQVELLPVTFQDYDPSDGSFDVACLMASINHLDEQATAKLHFDQDAQDLYRGLFEKLASVCRPGAKLIVVDCARQNLFARLGVTNPLNPTIEWHKHQQPEIWGRLLADAGFAQPQTRWLTFNSLRMPGQLLLGNRFAAYCLTSAFCLTMERGGDVIANDR